MAGSEGIHLTTKQQLRVEDKLGDWNKGLGRNKKRATERMKCVAVAVLLNLLSLGHSAPLSSCDGLVTPITISNEDMLGRWVHIGGSIKVPEGAPMSFPTSSMWLDITASIQNNTLKVLQTQKFIGICSNITYNVTFDNGTVLVEQPFLLKGTFLPTICSDCLVIYNNITIDEHPSTNLQLFSRKKCISYDDLGMFKRQAECLQMPTPTMMDTEHEFCSDDDDLPSGGLFSLLVRILVYHERQSNITSPGCFFDTTVN